MMKRRRPFKKPAAKKPAPIRIDGEHAKVRAIRKRGHPLYGRIERTLGSTFTPKAYYNLSHTLAHILFPENFAEPVAVSSGVRDEAMRKTYFANANISRESREAIALYYKNADYHPKYARHWRHLRENTTKGNIKIEQFAAAGIIPNDVAMNVGFRNNKPVFFEVERVNIKSAEEYARKNLKGLGRKQALSVILELKRHIPKEKWGEYCHVHY